MHTDKTQFGLRSRSTGKLVRLETRDYHHEIEGSSADYYLTFDDAYPLLQEDNVGGIMLYRYGRELVGRPSEAFYRGSGIEVEDLEIIEYLTTNRMSAGSGSDPSLFEVEVGRIEFDIVPGVSHQYVGSKSDMRKKMLSLFSATEVARMQEVPSLEFVVLKSKSMDVSSAGLVGMIITPPQPGLLHASRPLGIVDVRTVGGVTYAAVSDVITHPMFRRTVSLVDGMDPHEQPWDGLKIAFGFDDGDDAVGMLNGIWDDQLDGRSIWPRGWSLDETDRSGARMVVVFAVEGAVRESDGRIVRRMLNDICAGIDPRVPAAGAPARTRRS